MVTGLSHPLEEPTDTALLTSEPAVTKVSGQRSQNFLFMKMTGRRSLVGQRQRANRSRALAYVLLALLGFGSTAGVTHRHGKLQLNLNGPTTTFATTDASEKVSLPSSTSNSPEGSSDCLICHFQRSISNAEVFTPAVLQAPTGSFAAADAPSLSAISKTPTIGQGRAPPSIS
jgi:hypothetical protein